MWRAITAGFELDEHELTLLREAARTVDLLDALEAEVKRAGAVVDSPQGRKANPAAVERLGQQRLTLARLLVALRIPTEESQGVWPDSVTTDPRRVRGDRRMRARGTEQRDILATLPPELRLEASPERCVCVHCEPQLTAEERQADVDRRGVACSTAPVEACQRGRGDRDGLCGAGPPGRTARESSKPADKSSSGTKTKGSSTDV